jgi:hypothetical protein
LHGCFDKKAQEAEVFPFNLGSEFFESLIVLVDGIYSINDSLTKLVGKSLNLHSSSSMEITEL